MAPFVQGISTGTESPSIKAWTVSSCSGRYKCARETWCHSGITVPLKKVLRPFSALRSWSSVPAWRSLVTWGDHEFGLFEQDFGLELSSQKWEQPPLILIPKLPTQLIPWFCEIRSSEVQSSLVLLLCPLETLPTRQRNQGVGAVERLLPTSEIQSRPYKASNTGSKKPFLPPPPLEWFSPAQDLSLFLKTHQLPCNNFLGPVVFQWNLKNKNLGSLHHGSSNV